MKSKFFLLAGGIFVYFFSFNAFGQGNTKPSISVQIDGSKQFQQIDGFGVNANTRSWNGRELEPALELLLDSMNAKIWRVIVETVEKWEVENDNDDPFVFNWDYYNKLYETPKFQKAWDMIQYLNGRGITKNLMINFMGIVPTWMGGEVVKPEYEDEYVEMLVSFFYYAKNVRHLQIGSIGPINEPDIRKEGPTVGPVQYARILKKLIIRMEAVGLGDIPYVAPDVAGMGNGIKKYIPELMKEPVIMDKIQHIALHSYAGYYAPVDSTLKNSPYPNSDFWITEWNAWCKGCDDGILGEYNYAFAGKCVNYLLDLLKNGASAGIAWEGYDSYYEHHAPSLFSYWGMLSYAPETKTYHPRKNFYAIQQVSKFVLPGTRRIFISDSGDSLTTVAFYDALSRKVTIVGVNQRNSAVDLKVSLTGLPAMKLFEKYHTNVSHNLFKGDDINVSGQTFNTTIPANSIFTLTSKSSNSEALIKPEPKGWYAGDIHVHRSCDGSPPVSANDLRDMMEVNDLSVISVLADMGNNNSTDRVEDLKKVNGSDSPLSGPDRIIHYAAEWHWDATQWEASNQALGGHLVLLGLKEAHKIWDESTYKVLDWAGKQNAVRGFAHIQYLKNEIPDKLNCCIPIDYPVEAALKNIEFIAEEQKGGSENGILAYYKLLNCGFKLALAAGTDYSCNNVPLGDVLTYVEVPDKTLTYQKWIDGIAQGRTVVSRNAHNEFLELKVNKTAGPGSDIRFKKKGEAVMEVSWSVTEETSGWIELVINGQVVARQYGTAKPGTPLTTSFKQSFPKSGWISARRMDSAGHRHVLHTSPVYITINNQPVRVSKEDAQYFVAWIDNILKQIEPGAPWNKYFANNLDAAKERYQKARDIYNRIAAECKK